MGRSPDGLAPTRAARLGSRLWDAAFARAVDRSTSETFGIPSAVLMETAGREVARVAREAAAGHTGTFVILAGTGHNGGDALVAARWLLEARGEWRASVHVFLVGKEAGKAPEPRGLCADQAKTLAALGLAVTPWRRGALAPFARRPVVVIDGLLGTGLSGTLDGASPLAEALGEATTLEHKTVVAVDVPSGLGADSGDLGGGTPILRADFTVTFGARKPAHVVAPARDVCGLVVVADIGFPEKAELAAEASQASAAHLEHVDGAALLHDDPWAKLEPSAHKYDRGHVLVLGGSAGKAGAPLLTAMAALRAGAGWATVAMPESATKTLFGDVPREITFESLFRTGGETVDPKLLSEFLKSRRVRAVVAGPGGMTTPLDAESVAVLREFSAAGGFVLLDAGATHEIGTLLAAKGTGAPERWLLTPHPGEWTKLGGAFAGLAAPLSAVTVAAVASVAQRLGAAVLYKHATPVLVPATTAQGAVGYVMDEGSVALARAGSGDVYAGVAAAHGAVGLDATTAGLAAEAVIGRAAEIAAEAVGHHGILATDVIAALGLARGGSGTGGASGADGTGGTGGWRVTDVEDLGS